MQPGNYQTMFPIDLNPIYSYMVAMEQAKSYATRKIAFNAALDVIMGLFGRLDPVRWGESPGVQQYVLMTAHLVLCTGSSMPGSIPTVATVARALGDETYRQFLIERYPFKHDMINRFWTEREGALSEAQKTVLLALLRRFDLFMANPITRPMLSVEEPLYDLRKSLEKGEIAIVLVPGHTMGSMGPIINRLRLSRISRSRPYI